MSLPPEDIEQPWVLPVESSIETKVIIAITHDGRCEWYIRVRVPDGIEPLPGITYGDVFYLTIDGRPSVFNRTYARVEHLGTPAQKFTLTSRPSQ